MPACPQNGGPAPRLSRQLLAIAFADVVGYSILMASDEERTHRRWMGILDGIIQPRTEHYGGRVVKSTGDGVLVELPERPRCGRMGARGATTRFATT